MSAQYVFPFLPPSLSLSLALSLSLSVCLCFGKRLGNASGEETPTMAGPPKIVRRKMINSVKCDIVMAPSQLRCYRCGAGHLSRGRYGQGLRPSMRHAVNLRVFGKTWLNLMERLSV